MSTSHPKLAGEDEKVQFNSLWHHVHDVERLREVYLSLKRSAAAGVDGVTWDYYGGALDDNLKDLVDWRVERTGQSL